LAFAAEISEPNLEGRWDRTKYAYVHNNPLRWVDPMGLGATSLAEDLKPDAFALGLISGGSFIVGPNGVDVLGFSGIEFDFQNQSIDAGLGGTFAAQIAGEGLGGLSGVEVDLDTGIFFSKVELEVLPTLRATDVSFAAFTFRFFDDPAEGVDEIKAISIGAGAGCCGSSVRDAVGGVITFETLLGQ